MEHVPAKRVLFSPKTRDKETHQAFSQVLDMACHGKGKPGGGDVSKVKRKESSVRSSCSLFADRYRGRRRLLDLVGFREVVGVDLYPDTVAIGCGHRTILDGDLVAGRFPGEIIAQSLVFLMGSGVGTTCGIDSHVKESKASAGNVRGAVKAPGCGHPGNT